MRLILALAFGAAIALAAGTSARAACPNVAGYVHDSFAAPDAAWTKNAVTSGGGVLRFPLKPNTVSWAANHVDYISGDGSVCAVVKIDAARAKEEEAGIAFWMVFDAKTTSFYTFTISPSGTFAVAARDAQGRYTTLIRKKAASLHTAPGASNELRALGHGSSVRLVLNSVIVATIAAHPPSAPWYAGVFAISPDKSPANWEFTEFSVSP
jgi:hypothetical protein